MKWAIKLSQYNLLYQLKIAIKALALANFVVEFTLIAEEEKLVIKNKEISRVDDTSSADPDLPKDIWKLRVDGALNHKGVGAGVVIVTLDKTLLEQVITLGFPASNNEAEYEALLVRLRLAKELAKHSRMIQYLDKVQVLLKEFSTFIIQQVS
ncbi:unnamed protein product [Prunus armeniaca]